MSGVDRESLAKALHDMRVYDSEHPQDRSQPCRFCFNMADRLTPLVATWLDQARAEGAAEQAARVEAVLSVGEHVVDVTKTGYGLQHGFPCRPDLLGCPLNRALKSLAGPPASPGRYRVRLAATGEVVIGERVPDDYDPLTTDLRAALDPATAEQYRQQVREKALRDAAEAARGMHDPPEAECVEWADWLEARADREAGA